MVTNWFYDRTQFWQADCPVYTLKSVTTDNWEPSGTWLRSFSKISLNLTKVKSGLCNFSTYAGSPMTQLKQENTVKNDFDHRTGKLSVLEGTTCLKLLSTGMRAIPPLAEWLSSVRVKILGALNVPMSMIGISLGSLPKLMSKVGGARHASGLRPETVSVCEWVSECFFASVWLNWLRCATWGCVPTVFSGWLLAAVWELDEQSTG